MPKLNPIELAKLISAGTAPQKITPTESEFEDLNLDEILLDDTETIADDQPAEVARPTIEQLQEKLAQLQEQMGDESLVSLVGQSVRNLMIDIRDNPEFAAILKEEDIGVMVRALRRSYQQIASVKTAKKTSRSATAQKKTEIGNVLDGIFGGKSSPAIDIDDINLDDL